MARTLSFTEFKSWYEKAVDGKPESVAGRSEQLKAIQELKDHCSQRYEHWERDEIERLVDSL